MFENSIGIFLGLMEFNEGLIAIKKLFLIWALIERNCILEVTLQFHKANLVKSEA
jgi:hypothetical protein